MTRLPRITVAQTEMPRQDVQLLEPSSAFLAAKIQPTYSDGRSFQVTTPEQQSSDRLTLVSSSLDTGRADLAIAQSSIGVIPRPLDLYMLQVETIPTRGLKPADFVPSAEMLALSTRVWEQYLASIFLFLRNEQPIRAR